MKKLTLAFLTACMLSFLSPGQLMAKNSNKVSSDATMNTTVTSAETEASMVRLNEIKTMDKSELSSSEKKELRTETRAIKNDMKANSRSSSGGLYVSVGAAIIIVLLLVLLL